MGGRIVYLFRGKRIDSGKWIEGYYCKATRHWHKYGIHNDWIITSAVQNGGFFNLMGRYAVIPETVGQWTGLTDKNGVKIFEGDIVEGKAVNFFDITTLPAVVEFYNSMFGIWARKLKSNGGWCLIWEALITRFEYNGESKTNIEVIGNIYENSLEE